MFSFVFGPSYGSIQVVANPREENCSICLQPQNQSVLVDTVTGQVTELGKAIIHTKQGGEKHPIHEECFRQSLKRKEECPCCRIHIPKSAIPAYGSIKPALNPDPTKLCSVCLNSVTKTQPDGEELGVATIHTHNGGNEHPMHRLCFYKAVVRNPTCPCCRIPIPRSAFPDLNKFEWADLDRFGEKIVIPLVASASLISIHYGVSILTQSSLVAAAIIPVFMVIGVSLIARINSIRDLILRAKVTVFIAGVSVLASAIATVTTRSPLANSCVTVLITLVALKGIYDQGFSMRQQQPRAN
jgi:hypothetical protein